MIPKKGHSVEKKYFLYSIIKIYDVNYYLKLKKYTFCNLTIYELVNEIGDFESLCKVLCTRNCTKALKNIHNSKYSGSKKKIHYQEEWGSQVINAHKLMTAALSTDYNSPRSFRYICTLYLRLLCTLLLKPSISTHS